MLKYFNLPKHQFIYATLVIAQFVVSIGFCQTLTEYDVDLPNLVHHEAEITVMFRALENKVLRVSMSRSSPGRYALHEFAKNVYNVKAVNSQGKPLVVTRPNPYEWDVSGHDGTVKFTYTLFANRGGGTYSQFDETHAHMNIPATFMYAKEVFHRPVQVNIHIPKVKDWQVATQLKHLGGTSYYAPDVYYFMDSPIEVSHLTFRTMNIQSERKNYSIRLALHHNGTEDEVSSFFEQVKRVVQQEMAVFGELAPYDYGQYTIIACYVPNASGDGMEHKNSTICTTTRSLADGGLKWNIGTVTHEFFHSWNMERIRSRDIEPFDFQKANMSGELWFGEGFTSYYTGLILCRAGLRTQKEYIEGLANTLNYVLNSPGRGYFNPIEMSYQAPFVDAARSVDPVNKVNTFISYYSYGSALGLALDLSLRDQKTGLSLDGFMKLVWETYGKTEIPYDARDLQELLKSYAGTSFADHFFDQYIFRSQAPPYTDLFRQVGVEMKHVPDNVPYLGMRLQKRDSSWTIASNTLIDGPAYRAGLEVGDRLLKINDTSLGNLDKLEDIIKLLKVGKASAVVYRRFGVERPTSITPVSSPDYTTKLAEDTGIKPGKEIIRIRNDWLKAR